MSRAKTLLCVAFMAFHLVLIVLVSIHMTVGATCTLYDKDLPDNIAYRALSKTVNSKVLSTYGKYTGAEMGYGFFAPNVLSSGRFQFTKGSQEFDFAWKNHENWIRYMNMCNVFTSSALKDMTRRQQQLAGLKPPKKSHEYISANKIKYDDVDSAYDDLMLKCICYRYMRGFHANDTLVLALKISDFKKLSEYDHPTDSNTKYIVAYEKKYFVHHQR